MTLCMTGLDTIVFSPVVDALKKKMIEVVERDKITKEMLVPTSPQFNKTKAIGVLMEMLDAIPEATGGKISKGDIRTLITNILAGRDAVPESFETVFSPAMIDLDILDVIGDLPGIGDALGPIMALMQGSSTGNVGASPFGDAVPKPGWLSRD